MPACTAENNKVDNNKIMNNRVETTPRKRSAVISLFNTGTHSQRKISAITGIPKSTVADILTRAKVRNQHGLDPSSNYLRSGRPKIYTEDTKKQLLEIAEADPFSTISDIQGTIAYTTPSTPLPSRYTISSLFKEEGIVNRVARKKPFLKEQHKKARLAWCIARKDWTIEEWKRII